MNSDSVKAQNLKEVEASDIIKEINNEYTFHEPYKDLKIKGNFTLRGYIITDVRIMNSVFENDVDFSNTIFRTPLYLEGNTFLGKTDFSGASLDFSSFKYSNFTDSADFSNTVFNKVDFTGTKFIKITLNGSDFNKMTISWNDLKNSLVYDGTTYLKLIKNFKGIEQFDDANLVIYQYRQKKQESKNGLAWYWEEFQRLTYGYGVRPFNSFIFSSVIIFFFSYFYERDTNKIVARRDIFFKMLIRKIYKIIPSFFDKFLREANKITPNCLYEKSILILKRCLYFLYNFTLIEPRAIISSGITFFTFGFAPPKNDTEKLASFVEGLLGWIILQLFIISLASQIIMQ